jgi:cytochrome P450
MRTFRDKTNRGSRREAPVHRSNHLSYGRSVCGISSSTDHPWFFTFAYLVSRDVLIFFHSSVLCVSQVTGLRGMAKSPTYSTLLPLIGHHSMVVTEGEHWRRQRRAFNPVRTRD